MKKDKIIKILGVGNLLWLATVFCVYAGDLEMTKNNVDWVFFSDQVMGGKSQGQAQILHDQGNQFIWLKGDVSTANNGGFIQIRTSILGLKKDVKGLSLKVRGNGEKYYVFIRTTGTILPWHYYKADFPSKQEWSEVKLEFQRFTGSSSWLSKTIRPGAIKSVGIVAFGRDHKALIDVSDLEFF